MNVQQLEAKLDDRIKSVVDTMDSLLAYIDKVDLKQDKQNEIVQELAKTVVGLTKLVREMEGRK